MTKNENYPGVNLSYYMSKVKAKRASRIYLEYSFSSARSWLGTITEIVAFLNIACYVTVRYVPMATTGKVNIWKYNVKFFTRFFGTGKKK